jgi:hypothetical protein
MSHNTAYMDDAWHLPPYCYLGVAVMQHPQQPEPCPDSHRAQQISLGCHAPCPACRYSRYKGAANLDELNRLLTGVAMIRRRKLEVGDQLPPKQRQQVGWRRQAVV